MCIHLLNYRYMNTFTYQDFQVVLNNLRIIQCIIRQTDISYVMKSLISLYVVVHVYIHKSSRYTCLCFSRIQILMECFLKINKL